MDNIKFYKFKKSFLFVILVLLILLLSACSGGSSDSSGTTNTETGSVVIGLTDAAGDFATYTVDILSLTLTKADGAVVETLPVNTTVDFAQYVDMSELLVSATVPSGAYTAATMTLDFQNADIRVENANGDAVPVESIQDETGAPVTTLDVSVMLENQQALIVAPGVPAHLELDFDLTASNSVEFDQNGNPILTVSPTLMADINPKDQKIQRVRGPLENVDVENSSFSVIIRPFAQMLSGHQPVFGTLKVLTDDSTSFNISGQTYQGVSGLTALDQLPDYSAVVAVGNLKFNPYRFVASEVTAGSVVPGGEQDAVTGNVTDRTDNTFTVKGASLVRKQGGAFFNDEVSVSAGENTLVQREFSDDEFGINDISIGQRVTFFGTLTKNSEGQWEMDATQGSCIMLLTTLKGTVVNADSVSADETPLVMNLQSIDNRQTDIFDFSLINADPADYEINTGSLDISGLVVDAPVRILGFVSPFDENTPDFYAYTIVNASDVKSVLKVNWMPPSSNAIQNVSSQELTLNLSGTGIFHYVDQGGVATDLTQLAQSPQILPSEDESGVYSIHGNGPWQVYSTFTDFEEALAGLMDNGGAEIQQIEAIGLFNKNTGIFKADTIRIRLNPSMGAMGSDSGNMKSSSAGMAYSSGMP